MRKWNMILRFFVLLLLPVVVVSQECKPDMKIETTNEGMLRSFLMPIELDNPEIDAQKRAHNKDFRFLATGSYSGLRYPGLNENQLYVICRIGYRTIDGLTDAYNSKEHLLLAKKVRKYATIYNKEILRLFKLFDTKTVSDKSGDIYGRLPENKY